MASTNSNTLERRTVAIVSGRPSPGRSLSCSVAGDVALVPTLYCDAMQRHPRLVHRDDDWERVAGWKLLRQETGAGSSARCPSPEASACERHLSREARARAPNPGGSIPGDDPVEMQEMSGDRLNIACGDACAVVLNPVGIAEDDIEPRVCARRDGDGWFRNARLRHRSVPSGFPSTTAVLNNAQHAANAPR